MRALVVWAQNVVGKHITIAAQPPLFLWQAWPQQRVLSVCVKSPRFLQQASFDHCSFVLCPLLLRSSFGDYNLRKTSRSEVWAMVQGLSGNTIFTFSGWKELFLIDTKDLGTRAETKIKKKKLSRQTAPSILSGPDSSFL